MPSPSDPIAFSIFGIDMRWYALFMLAGVVAGLLLARFLAGRIGLDPDWVIDAAPWVVLFAILGARSYYVALRADYFLVSSRRGGQHSPRWALLPWRPHRRYHRLRGSLPADEAAVLLVDRRRNSGRGAGSGHRSVGQLGESGSVRPPTTAPWGLWIDPDRRPPQFAAVERFHPTFLYESLFNLANAARAVVGRAAHTDIGTAPPRRRARHLFDQLWCREILDRAHSHRQPLSRSVAGRVLVELGTDRDWCRLC